MFRKLETGDSCTTKQNKQIFSMEKEETFLVQKSEKSTTQCIQKKLLATKPGSCRSEKKNEAPKRDYVKHKDLIYQISKTQVLQTSRVTKNSSISKTFSRRVFWSRNNTNERAVNKGVAQEEQLTRDFVH